MPRASTVKATVKKSAAKKAAPATKATSKATSRPAAKPASAVRSVAARKALSAAVKPAASPAAKAATPAAKPAPKSSAKAASQPAARPEPEQVSSTPSAAQAAVAALTPPRPAERLGDTAVYAAPLAAAVRPSNPVARPESRYAGITESQLLKQPAGDYMNAAQLAFFKEVLEEMRNEIIEKADATSEHLREHEIEPDPTDQATIEEEYALELRARDRERKLLKKIMQALGRIADGSYGYCEETGEPIGLPRLLARPTASMSVEAQSRRELKQKLYGD
jgi:DnaK suppressor protein